MGTFMRRVVVTGLGIVSPLGTGLAPSWSGAIEGRSGIGEITRFDTTAYPTEFPVTIAGEVPDFDPKEFIGKKDIKKMDTFIQYAVAASDMALKDSGFEVTE